MTSGHVAEGMGELDGVSAAIIAGEMTDRVAIGLAGCSIEDHTGSPDNPIYDFALAVERIAAAAEAARGLASDFVLTARCENLLWDRPNLDDVVKRLQAFEQAGADVLFAPGLRDPAAIGTVCGAVSRPVNIVMELSCSFTRAQAEAAGVKRISTGSKLACLAYGALVKATREMAEQGSFGFTAQAMGFAELSAYFTTPPAG